MPLIVTPKQLSLRAEVYHQLGALLSAGVPLTNALETLHKNPPARSFRQPIAELISELEQGSTFTEALLRAGRWMPSFDVALLQAGEHSGRLDACFKLLADYYQERAQLVRQTMGQLAYPVFLLHFAVFIGPFPQLFVSGDVAAYLTQTLGALAPIYAVVFLLILACQSRHGELWRGLVERAGRFIPILGTARRHLALARLSAALEALLNAGVSIISAWELAAAASGSPALHRTVVAWRPRVEHDGERPSEVVSESNEFPELFANLYHTGEISGTLDETLRRLHRHYQEEGARKLKGLAEWLPRLVYFGIMLTIAYRVVTFYTGYYSNIFNSIQ
jgi:type II secretory pathway component PulF